MKQSKQTIEVNGIQITTDETEVETLIFEQQKCLAAWIQVRLRDFKLESNRISKANSPSCKLKLVAEKALGFCISNLDFKVAMARNGYRNDGEFNCHFPLRQAIRKMDVVEFLEQPFVLIEGQTEEQLIQKVFPEYVKHQGRCLNLNVEWLDEYRQLKALAQEEVGVELTLDELLVYDYFAVHSAWAAWREGKGFEILTSSVLDGKMRHWCQRQLENLEEKGLVQRVDHHWYFLNTSLFMSVLPENLYRVVCEDYPTLVPKPRIELQN